MMLCSSEVTMQPVSSAAFLTSSPSSREMLALQMSWVFVALLRSCRCWAC